MGSEAGYTTSRRVLRMCTYASLDQCELEFTRSPTNAIGSFWWSCAPNYDSTWLDPAITAVGYRASLVRERYIHIQVCVVDVYADSSRAPWPFGTALAAERNT